MFRRILLASAMLMAFMGVTLFIGATTHAAPNYQYIFQENAEGTNLDGRYSDGKSRSSKYDGVTATMPFQGTFITWYTHTGRNEGIAEVLIDGATKCSCNLYA